MWMLPYQPVCVGKINGDRIEAVIVSSGIGTYKHPLRRTSAQEVRQIVQTTHEVDVDMQTSLIRNSDNRFAAGLHDVENLTNGVDIESSARDPFVEVEADRAARTQ